MKCPACTTDQPLKPHCRPTTKTGQKAPRKHPTCTWLECRACRLVFDLRRMIGYDRNYRRVRITNKPNGG